MLFGCGHESAPSESQQGGRQRARASAGGRGRDVVGREQIKTSLTLCLGQHYPHPHSHPHDPDHDPERYAARKSHDGARWGRVPQRGRWGCEGNGRALHHRWWGRVSDSKTCHGEGGQPDVALHAPQPNAARVLRLLTLSSRGWIHIQSEERGELGFRYQRRSGSSPPPDARRHAPSPRGLRADRLQIRRSPGGRGYPSCTAPVL